MTATATPPRLVKEPTVSAFGSLILKLRTQRGWTQDFVARAVGMSPGYVGLLEKGLRGRSINRDAARRFAQAFKLDLNATEELLRAAGHLGEGEVLFPVDHATTQNVIEEDTSLTDPQRRVLLGVYSEFVRGI